MNRLAISTAAIVLVLLVVGLYSEQPAGTSPRFGGTFRGYLTSEPSNLDPARGVDVNEGSVQAKLYDGLVRYDESMRLVGNLAESWEVSGDGRQYRFRLRQGVKFHNGQPFTAKDVLFSFDRLLDPKTASPRSWVLEKVVGAKERLEGKAEGVAGLTCPDAYTVCIELTEPFAPFLSLLSMPAGFILPSGSAAAIAQKGFFEKPIGTGPFQAAARERDSYIRLEAFPGYHGPKPHVGAIELRIIPESLKAEMEFESGNLDILQLNPSNFQRFTARPDNAGRVHDVPAMNVFYVGLNNQAAPFDDVRVRRALNLLIDRQAILAAVFQGRGVPAAGSIPPGILGHSDGLTGYGFDPARGKALLAEAGYGPGKPLKFDLFQKSSQAAFEITRLLQGELKKHGVEVTLKPMEWSALKDAINRGEAPSFYLSWYGDYPDGENFLFPLFHSKNWGAGGNRAHYKNERVDAMLAEALRIQDPDKRGQAYDAINRLVVAEAPWIYLWHTPETYLLGPSVKDMVFSPLFAFDKGLTIRTAQ
ncbi:MAG: ABC transporter substrate-binding protein [Candidatus Riflebacteria bacterium]|nr:ABC transporter substrate-binding protein [Candidatus Riflebacteria bacterium]